MILVYHLTWLKKLRAKNMTLGQSQKITSLK